MWYDDIYKYYRGCKCVLYRIVDLKQKYRRTVSLLSKEVVDLKYNRRESD